MFSSEGSLLSGCTAVLGPIYPVVIDDVPVGGTIHITYEPVTEKRPDTPDYSKAKFEVDPYEFNTHILLWLNNITGIHKAEVEEEFGNIVVSLRPYMVQDPRQCRKLWDAIRLFLLNAGAELASYSRFDADHFKDAYEAWLNTLK